VNKDTYQEGDDACDPEGDELDEVDALLVELKASGVSDADAASRLGRSTKTIQRHRKRPAVVAALAARKAERVSQVAALLGEAAVDAVAAMRFEARIEGSDETIIDTHDILTAQAVSLHDKGPNGSTKSTFGIALTFTNEGGEKRRRQREAHTGQHLELLVADKVIM